MRYQILILLILFSYIYSCYSVKYELKTNNVCPVEEIEKCTIKEQSIIAKEIENYIFNTNKIAYKKILQTLF